MTHESSCGYLSLCFGTICRASDQCSGHERASNPSAITRGFPKNYFSESTTLANICPSGFLLELPIVAACIFYINNLKLTVNNSNNTAEPCPCCGFHLISTHAVGCSNKHGVWIHKNGMRLSPGNAELLKELSQLVETKNK